MKCAYPWICEVWGLKPSEMLKGPDYASYVSAACLVALLAAASGRMTDTAREALNPRYAAVCFRVIYCIDHTASAMMDSTIKWCDVNDRTETYKQPGTFENRRSLS